MRKRTILLLLSVLAFAAGCASTTGPAPAATTSAASAARTGTGPDSSYTTVALNAQPTTPVKTTVLSIKNGNGQASSKTFAISQTDYSVAYAYNCSGAGGEGNFIADVMSPSDTLFDDSVANAIGASGASTSYFHDGPGTFYVTVDSECTWTLTVTDGDNG